MADPVRLFVRAGELMLFDDIVAIVVDGRAANQPCLCPPVHDLAVDIKARLCILFAHAILHKPFEIFPRFLINTGVIKIDGRIQINLRLVDMQKGIGVPLYHFPRLRAAHHIVGKRRHLLRIVRKGPDRRKGPEYCHRFASFLTFKIK